MRCVPKPVHLRVDMSVRHEDIRPTIVIEVDKAGAPTDEARIHPDTAMKCHIVKRAVSAIVVERTSVLLKICLYQVEKTVSVVVTSVRSHTALLSAILVVGHPGERAGFRKGSIAVVVVEQAGSRIVRYINIRPTIVVIVENKGANP
jgi:hypothetical protein